MPQPPKRRTAARQPDSDIRAALDGLRRIVQGLRLGGAPAGLSSAQLFALQQIARQPGSSINDLAALTYTHQSSVSVVVRRLVESRLVVKVSSPDDRRRQSLAVTAKGQRALQRSPAPVQQRLIAALGELSKTERRQLIATLTRVADSIAPAGGPPPMLFEDARRR